MLRRVCTLAMIGALFPLAGCGNTGVQSRGVSAPIPGQTQNTGKNGGYLWRWVSYKKIPPHGQHSFQVECPKNYVVTGGGFRSLGGPAIVTYSSFPAQSLGYWNINVLNTTSLQGGAVAFAVCAPTT